MFRFFLRFKLFITDGKSSEMSCMRDFETPIEYDSDISDLQSWAEDYFKVEGALLLDWRELKGRERPSALEAHIGDETVKH